MTPEPGELVAAAHDNRFDLVRRFLTEGSDVDERDEWGGTALGYALAAHNEDAVRLLLENGANVNATDKRGLTPMYYSVLWCCPVSLVMSCLAHGGHVTFRELWLIDDQEIHDVGNKDVHQLLRHEYEVLFPDSDMNRQWPTAERTTDMSGIIHAERPEYYDRTFWKELSQHPETERRFREVGCDWEKLGTPHREICIDCHNKAMRSG